MTILKIRNPFNAPVYHAETVTSTMDISRELAAAGKPHGTVIIADFQEAGRGRIRDRSWKMEEKEGLSFTLLLRFPRIKDIPGALTLRVGLAVSLAIEDFIPSLKDEVMVKWPNDIIINSKKAAGILCEANDGIVHIGIGINIAQKEFPVTLRQKATSIAIAAGMEIAPGERFCLLEKILVRLTELQTADGGDVWRSRLEQRLFKNGEQVVFVEGAAYGENQCGNAVSGRMTGIGPGGELLIIPNGETEVRSFISGELQLYIPVE